jgi:hypothetical protein
VRRRMRRSCVQDGPVCGLTSGKLVAHWCWFARTREHRDRPFLRTCHPRRGEKEKLVVAVRRADRQAVVTGCSASSGVIESLVSMDVIQGSGSGVQQNCWNTEVNRAAVACAQDRAAWVVEREA